MGSGTLTTRANLFAMDATWWNSIRDAIATDLVPRNSSAVPTDLASSLGSSSYSWDRIFVMSGHFSVGDIKFHFPYNGAAQIGHGWMLCDGRVISQSNYDSEHGAGAWASYVSSSILINKYLPNLVARYAIGSASTTQDGSSVISSVGNVNHTLDLRHSHRWNENNANAVDNSFDSSGNVKNYDQSASKNAGGFYSIGVVQGNPGVDVAPSLYSDVGGISPFSVQPQSIQALPYMRII